MKKKILEKRKKVSGVFAEFKEFAANGQAIVLAVGIIIGSAFQTIIRAIVDYIVMPLFSLISPEKDFKSLDFKILNAEVKLGEFIGAIVNFFIIMFVMFLIIKFLNKMKPPKKDDAIKRDEQKIEILNEILNEIKKSNRQEK